jgi:hypothetical protein
MKRRRFGSARALRITEFMTLIFSKGYIPVKEYTGKSGDAGC